MRLDRLPRALLGIRFAGHDLGEPFLDLSAPFGRQATANAMNLSRIVMPAI